jgi:hypothetical protein
MSVSKGALPEIGSIALLLTSALEASSPNFLVLKTNYFL